MSRAVTVERLQAVADDLRTARDPKTDPTNESPTLRRVRAWQAARLAISFADLRDSAKYTQAAEFFLSDLYGEQDVSWRDRDLARMMPTLVRWLPEAMLGTVCDALELDLLSHRLDLQLARVLQGKSSRAPTLDIATYGDAYRASCTAAQRAAQIDLLMRVGRELEHIVRVPLVYGVLRIARGPASRAGLGNLQAFLERGFAAFRAMGKADEFLRIIESRERLASRKLFAADAEPFGPGFAEPQPAG